MTPVPKTKSQDIILRLNDMRIGDQRNVFTLQRYRKDAEAIASNSPASGYNILGAISCLEKKIDEMREWHKKAIVASGNDPTFIRNYAMSLNRLGFSQEAYKLMVDVVSTTAAPADKMIFVCIAAGTGRLIEASEFIRNMTAEDIQLAEIPESIIDGIFEAVDVLSCNGLTDADVSFFVNTVDECLHELGVFGFSRNPSVYHGTDIVYSYQLSFEELDLLDLDYQIEQALIQKGVTEQLLAVLDIDFEDCARSSGVSSGAIKLSKEKLALIESLVEGVEI